MTFFAGWHMPLYYDSILKEHSFCRRKACVFDTSHMGRIRFRGNIAKSGIEKAFTRNISKIPSGRARYGFVLNEKGGIIDDMIAFKVSADDVLFIVNASSSVRDIKAMRNYIQSGEIKDESGDYAKIDLQGPASDSILKKVLRVEASLKPFAFRFLKISSKPVMLSRSGYTGENGYEIYTPASNISDIWASLLSCPDVRPAGLGARDILRMEMGYCLYGSDISEDITPLEAGLEKYVDFEKDFAGKKTLLKQKKKGISKKRVGIKSHSKRAPRRGYQIFCGDKKAGKVTSGSFSPSLQCGIALAYVESGLEKVGTQLQVERGINAEVSQLPFYNRSST